ncbi:MAG: FG-GAP repeat domain-containing protein, partial [Planctomycetota bacterium]
AELKKIKRMYAAGDIDGLIAMLAEGQPETKIAALNFLAERQDIGNVKPSDQIKVAYAKGDVESPFVAGPEKGTNNIIWQDPPAENLTETGEVEELWTVGQEDVLVEANSVLAGKYTVAVDFDGYVVYPADVDGDGDLDVVGSADEGRSFDIGRVETTGVSRTRVDKLGAVEPSVEYEYDVKTTSEERDDRSGLLRRSFRPSDDADSVERGALYWWENIDGKGTAWAQHVVDVNFGGAEVVFPSDIDGDGDMDIIGSDEQAGALVWWENAAGNGTVWTKQMVDADRREQHLVWGADIDADGDTDVVGATYLDGGIYWWENTSRNGTVWQKHVVDSNMDQDYCRTHCLRVDDMDGDGRLDIVASAGTESGINWWQNPKGDANSWTRRYVAGSDGEVESVYPADLDGDGDVDIVGSIRNHDGLTWWENTNGAGTAWAKHVIDSSYTDEQVVDVADMDNDGDMDIAASAREINSIIWWENTNGKATEWAKHVMNQDFEEVWSVYAVDMNGDGNLDMLAVARGAGEIAWFENQPAD